MKYLGIDFGSKKVGLALSDDAGQMGFPHDVVPNSAKLSDHICALVAEKEVGAVVIGDSRNFKDVPNPIAVHAKSLGDTLARRCGIPVFYEAEILTTAEAARLPEKPKKTRAPKARVPVDASAAALILTSFLSKHTHE